MLKWIGHLKGIEGLTNIPARDLSDEEVTQFGGEKTLIASGCYEKPAQAPRQPIVDFTDEERPIDE